MGIFSRRTIQQMINENAKFISEKLVTNHVSRLNREDFQSIDTEWEIAVLNVFSKLGKVVHEPALEGTSKLDLLFTDDDGSTFLADITSVSDEGFEDKTAVKAFEIELKKRLEKEGLLFEGWALSIGRLPNAKYVEQQKPALPPKSDFAKEIFNANFKKFLKYVKEHAEQSCTYNVTNEKTAISLTYHPNSKYFTSNMPVYNQAIKKDQNSVFNALKQKAKQLKKVSYEGFKGIILCDGGSSMMSSQSNSGSESSYNAIDATNDFLRQNQSINFVILVSSVWVDNGRYPSLPDKPARKIQISIVENKNFDSLPASLKDSLRKLEKHFPEPVNTADGARETIRLGFDPKASTPLAGGIGWSHNEISISVSSVFALLAGKITQEEFFKSLGFKPQNESLHGTRNIFEYMLNKKMRIIAVQVEDKIYDDSSLIFKFEGPNPAISPYVNPKYE